MNESDDNQDKLNPLINEQSKFQDLLNMLHERPQSIFRLAQN